MQYRQLSSTDLVPALFESFNHHQVVTQCYRKEQGQWVIKPIAFVEHWGQGDLQEVIQDLTLTIQNGGVVLAAYHQGALKGFASVEGTPLPTLPEHLDLSNLYVSADMRGLHIGQTLFLMAAGWARDQGAKKLYISSHSSVETQAFYKAMGCEEAQRYSHPHVLKEPCDCQLEFDLNHLQTRD